MSGLKTLLCVALLLTGHSGYLLAEVYKWTDEQGRVHYGDKPRHQNAESVKLPRQETPAAVPGHEERLEKQRRLLNAFEEERRIKREADAKAREEKAERRRKCLDIRDDLRTYEDTPILYRLDKEGKRIYMSPEERERVIAKTRLQIEQWCDE